MMPSGGGPAAVVADTFQAEGMPLESAAKFAHIAVETLRVYLWRVLPCTCAEEWSSRDLRDPRCSAHDYDLELGGDGDGALLLPEQERERMAARAVQLREQYGEQVYRQVFAPVYAKLLENFNDGGA